MPPTRIPFLPQTSPYPCVDANGFSGCGAKADEPCKYRENSRLGIGAAMASTPRAVMHSHRPRAKAVEVPPTSTRELHVLKEQVAALAERERQPAPVANEHPPIVPQVIDDLRARMAHGIKTYGVPLQPHNGRNAAQDAYEEALDMAAYLKQLVVERRAMVREIDRLKAENAALLDTLGRCGPTAS